MKFFQNKNVGACILGVFICLSSSLYAIQLSDVRCIAAYGVAGAYAIDMSDRLLRWNTTTQTWDVVSAGAPALRQMDADSAGNYLIGTKDDDTTGSGMGHGAKYMQTKVISG